MLKNKYDLEDRTAKFGKDVIRFAKKIPVNSVTMSLITQLVRSATSVGANYCEADNAESRKDFKHKIGICKKEAKETKHWLRMMIVSTSDNIKEEADVLRRESNELTLIFNAIYNSTKRNC